MSFPLKCKVKKADGSFKEFSLDIEDTASSVAELRIRLSTVDTGGINLDGANLLYSGKIRELLYFLYRIWMQFIMFH